MKQLDDLTELLERYYVADDCILDRLQPELCCPFPSNADALDAMEEKFCKIHEFAWIGRSALDPPKRKVDIEYVRNLLAELDKIDAIPLSEMQLYENGQKIEILPETIEEWRFVGLSNRAFIEMEVWKHPERLMEPIT